MFSFGRGKKRAEMKLYYAKPNIKTQEKDIEELVYKIKEIFQGHASKDIIILCIGSDLSIGDSLGPLVGMMLKEHQVPYHVYGTLEEPVHAQNLKSVLKNIHKQFAEPFIFSIDASLGDKSKIGYVSLEKGPIYPGTALKKLLPGVGEYHMKAVVNYVDPSAPTRFFKETRLYTVMYLATFIATSIAQAAGRENHAPK